jgi:hypothetical protein
MQVTDKEYKEHSVFTDLALYADFYETISMSIFQFPTMGTKALCNIDTYVYTSIQGTLESIHTILSSGRINDAYALVRKYHDSAIINTYTNLYIANNFSIENFTVAKIHNWLRSKEKIPEYRVMNEYIKNSPQLKEIYGILNNDKRYKGIRDRGNDNTHYNYFDNVMVNDNKVHIKNRADWLNKIQKDVKDIFILHLALIFTLNSHYMMSSDYLDSLECGMKPEENSQYWVANFIHEIFDKVITPTRPEVTKYIKNHTAMHLA